MISGYLRIRPFGCSDPGFDCGRYLRSSWFRQTAGVDDDDHTARLIDEIVSHILVLHVTLVKPIIGSDTLALQLAQIMANLCKLVIAAVAQPMLYVAVRLGPFPNGTINPLKKLNGHIVGCIIGAADGAPEAFGTFLGL